MINNMKYIKLFEELKADTYLRASNKLKQIGHKRRSEVLDDWHKATRKKENLIKWSKLGTFNISFFDRRDKFLFDGEFNIGLEVNTDFLSDRIYEILQDLEQSENPNPKHSSKLFISFLYGVLPTNKETEEKMVKAGMSDVMYYGSYWEGELSIKLAESGFNILPKAECYYEPYMNFEYRPSNRREAIKLHRSLVNLFEQKIDIPNIWGTIERTRSMIEEKTGDKELWDKIVNSVKNMPLNYLYKE